VAVKSVGISEHEASVVLFDGKILEPIGRRANIGEEVLGLRITFNCPINGDIGGECCDYRK
jgi:hypothetical protein